MEGLRKQLGKLDERARSKEQDLEDTLSKLEAFYKAYDAVMEDVQEVNICILVFLLLFYVKIMWKR